MDKNWERSKFKICLNEYQKGVCKSNIVYYIIFLDDESGKAICRKGLLAYDVTKGKWMANCRCHYYHQHAITQIL